jgi:uncharacterized membrane protein YkgB
MDTVLSKRLNLSLLLLRLGIFVVMALWAVDKFVNPGHTAAVFKAFYSYEGLGAGVSYALGAIQLLVVIAFVVGYKRTWFYGIVLALHGVSTLVSFSRYLEPWSNLLFFAAWPMLAACVALFLLREYDGWTIDGRG